MATVKAKVERLEKAAKDTGVGKFVVVYDRQPGGYDPLPPEELEAKLKAAHEEAGEGGAVYVVTYVKEWRGPVLEEGE
jgi:hypothetical protein